MKESFSSERTPDVKGWKETLEILTLAHQASIKNPHDTEKLEAFKNAWKKAFAEAATTDEMGELIHHVPNTEDRKEIQAKWDRLSDEEEAKLVGTHNLQALKHAYDNAPFDEYRQLALQKLIEEITDEKTAKHFHNISDPGSDLSLALEEKFPKIFSKKEMPVENETSEEDGGLYDIKEEEAEILLEDSKEKTNSLIQKIRKALGL